MHYKNASVHCIGKWLMQCPLKGGGGLRSGCSR